MRQLIGQTGGVAVGRAPRPSSAAGRVLVRVAYSLISTGTELAPLRSAVHAATDTRVEKAQALGGLAREYLAKARRDPRKAWVRLGQLARSEWRRRTQAEPRMLPEHSRSVADLEWKAECARDCEVHGGRLRATTDPARGAYQAMSTALVVPDGLCAVIDLRGRVDGGRVVFGALNESRDAWLAQVSCEGIFDEQLAFDPGSAQQAFLVLSTCHGDPGSAVELEPISLGFLRREDFARARGDLEHQGWNLGYSAAGTVVEIGAGIDDLAVGDRVACAGAGFANHADYVSVPRNLVARVPHGCDLRAAATTTVGSIALQGVRRAAPQLGETACVIGLGLIGQLSVGLLAAAGCRVIGSDLDAKRIERARAFGLRAGALEPAELLRIARDATGGRGVDCTILAAATHSSAPVNLAMELTRAKGRVVLVGDVGLEIERAAFYRKEIDLCMSTSYGPGRYDPAYELEGRDYPYGHVRWTLNRNMQAYLELLAEGRLDALRLIDRTVAIEQAPRVYQELAQTQGDMPLGVLLSYPESAEAEQAAPRRITLSGHRRSRKGPLQYALVGAGAFGTSLLAPELRRQGDRFFLRAVVSESASSHAANFARAERVPILATDLDSVLEDDSIELVVIASRHHRHADQVVRALQAGKHVFVEKPLALSFAELDRVIAAQRSLAAPPLLAVGFNRRFSPALVRLQEELARRRSPLVLSYRVNAGYLPPDHWVQTAQGGGRNRGEACHMYDVFRFLAGHAVTEIHAQAIDPGPLPYLRTDGFSASLRYADGSLATLVYTALGPRQGLAKESLEVFADGEAWILDDFQSLRRASDGAVLWKGTQDKGHGAELARLGAAIAAGAEPPIPSEELFETSAVALEIEEQLRGGGKEVDE